MTVDQIDARMASVDRPEDPYRDMFAAHFSGMLRLAALLGADDPEDVAQEAFVRLHRHRTLIRDHNAALGYLRRTVVNLANSRFRHLRVVRRHISPWGNSRRHRNSYRCRRCALSAADPVG